MYFKNDDPINSSKYILFYTIACLDFFCALLLIIFSIWLYLKLLPNKQIISNSNLHESGIGFGNGRLTTQAVRYPIDGRDFNTLGQLSEGATEDFSNNSSLPNYRDVIIEVTQNCLLNEDFPPAYNIE